MLPVLQMLFDLSDYIDFRWMTTSVLLPNTPATVQNECGNSYLSSISHSSSW